MAKEKKKTGSEEKMDEHANRIIRVLESIDSHLASLVYHQLPSRGFGAESAVVVRACRRGMRVLTTPVEMGMVDGRATSHYRPLLDSLLIARAVLGARLERPPR